MNVFQEKVKGKYMTATLVSAKTGKFLQRRRDQPLMPILRKDLPRTLFGVISFIKVTMSQGQP